MWLTKHEWHLDYIRLAKDNGFSFEKTRFPLDKNKISLLDLDKVIEERDVGIIEQFLPSVVQYNIDTNEHLGILDPNFLKLFRMSQLAVEYLLFCKKYLDHNVIMLKDEMKEVKMENYELRTFNDELKQHTDTLLSKLKRKEELTTTFKCNKCSKAFSTEEYLSAHIARRHTSKNVEISGLDIEMEIKEIKEKLNNNEKLMKNEEINPKLEDTLNKNYTKVSELLLKFESLKSQVENDFKMLHSQKDFEEKYLKIFQTALENVKIQINKELGIQSSPYKFNEKRNSITQTDLDSINTSEKNVPADENSDQLVRYPKQKFEEQKLQKLEDQMKIACESISHTMGSSLKNVEVQMQALWDKLQELDAKKNFGEKINDSDANATKNVASAPKPKTRKRYSSKLENTTTRPSSDTRYDTLDDFEKKVVLPDEGITVVKSLEPSASSDSKIKFENDLDRIDVLDDPEPSKPITVVKSINSLYETEDFESDQEDTQLSSEVMSETEISEDLGLNELPASKALHQEKSGSTLGKRSISSLRRASVSSEVMERLKKEMEKVLDERLSLLGVSNEWKGIPQRTYSRVMDILKHQSKILQRSLPDYKHIRKELLMKVEEELERKGPLKNEGQKKNKKTKFKGVSSLRALNTKNSSLRIRKYKSAPEVEIKNRKMYESESSSEEEQQKINLRTSSNIIHRTPNYSAVIEELKQTQRSDDEPKDTVKTSLPNDNLERMDLQMKSVLKNFPTVGPVPKKRVLFDLKSQETEIPKPVTRDVGGGSTTSIASSVLDLSDDSPSRAGDRGKTGSDLDIKDFSDDDFSIFENIGEEAKK
ncbi:zinc finger protein DZIP1 isoform X2 [Coccinella septempunctata]|uniref:zinc finger protein DZIP1 isoform X2 n=1 Tax=Coccinella septempunctata TaxID=41139 RepID=UPI001D0843A1|nr:zinc finger protein DZIP1 isoform X2 [Coccinella septempunctata]